MYKLIHVRNYTCLKPYVLQIICVWNHKRYESYTLQIIHVTNHTRMKSYTLQIKHVKVRLYWSVSASVTILHRVRSLHRVCYPRLHLPAIAVRHLGKAGLLSSGRVGNFVTVAVGIGFENSVTSATGRWFVTRSSRLYKYILNKMVQNGHVRGHGLGYLVGVRFPGLWVWYGHDLLGLPRCCCGLGGERRPGKGA